MAAKSTAVVGDTGKWDAMKEHCKGRLAVNHRVFLNMVQGAVDGDCLTLYCQNEFVRDSLNNNTVLHVLQEVASAAEGQTIRVALTVGGAPAGKKPAKPRPKPEKVTEKAPEKPPEEVPEPEQTPPGRSLQRKRPRTSWTRWPPRAASWKISKSSDRTILNQYYKGDFDHG